MAVVAQRVAAPPRALTDHQLVTAARCGSDRAFEELYRRYAGRIRGFVAGRVADPGRAEDLTQEIFLNAVRRLRATDTPVAFKPWLFEIAQNACIDEFRRARRAPVLELAADELEQVAPVAVPPPEVAVAVRQQLEDLRGAFHGLSPQQHRLLVLRELEGRSYEDIGVRLGMSRSMVESGLFRARRKLHEEYDELVTGRRCTVVQAMLADEDERGRRRLGVRQRRQLARHLAHCQPCRRVARAVGLPDRWLSAPSLAGRIAALLPVPWLPWRGSRWASSSSAPLRQMRQAGSLMPLADPTGPLQSLGRAVAAAAAILIAGIGGNMIVGHTGGEATTRPIRSVAAARSPATPTAAHQVVSPTGTHRSPQRAGRPVVARVSAPGGVPPAPVAPPPPSARRGSPAASGALGVVPASGSTTSASPAARMLATETGVVSSDQPAGAVLGTAAGLAQAAVAAAQSVGVVSAVPSNVAHTATTAGGAVAASAGTTAAAAGSTAGRVVARN